MRAQHDTALVEVMFWQGLHRTVGIWTVAAIHTTMPMNTA